MNDAVSKVYAKQLCHNICTQKETLLVFFKKAFFGFYRGIGNGDIAEKIHTNVSGLCKG